MSTRTPYFLLPATLATVVLLSACTAAPEQAGPATSDETTRTPPAAAAADSRTARLQAFLVARYGNQASLAGRWPGQWTQDEQTHPVSWQVCAEQPVVIGKTWQQLLAVCGEQLDAGHVSSGTIDFYVLRPVDDAFEVVAERTGGAYGSSGRPGTVDIIRAGSDFYGFRNENSWTGQGYFLQSQNLILPGPHGLVEAGSLRSHIDNNAALDCDDPTQTEDCRARNFDVDFTLRMDDSDRSARVWPLLVEETGANCGARVHEQHRFTLDPATWTYRFPDSLKREGCE